MNTSLFVKNAPSYAGLGVGGEGYTAWTIAGSIGDGLTTARTLHPRAALHPQGQVPHCLTPWRCWRCRRWRAAWWWPTRWRSARRWSCSMCEPVSPGKYLVLFAGRSGGGGGVGGGGQPRRAASSLVDRLLLPHAHAAAAARDPRGSARVSCTAPRSEPAGIVELALGRRRAARRRRCVQGRRRAAAVPPSRPRHRREGMVRVRGDLQSVEAAVLAATQAAGEGLLAGAEIIAAPHGDLLGRAL